MKKTAKISLSILFMFQISSCVTKRVFYDNQRSMDFYNVKMEPLKRSEYTIIGDVEGVAKYERGKLIIGNYSYDSYNKNVSVKGLENERDLRFNYKIPAYEDYDEIEQAAIFDALSKIPDADFLISLKFEKSSVLSTTHTDAIVASGTSNDIVRIVKVRGKAVKIKIDNK